MSSFDVDIEKLENDLLDGRCIFVNDKRGKFVSFAASTMIELYRDDGLISVQLGTWINDAAVPFMRLPVIPQTTSQDRALQPTDLVTIAS